MNAVKFNEYASVVVSAGYDRSLRVWDCRSQSTEPIQVSFFSSVCYNRDNLKFKRNLMQVVIDLQIIDPFLDSVMSVCLTKTEIIAGSVDGTVRTFDIRIGRYVTDMIMVLESGLILVFLTILFLFSLQRIIR